MVNVFVSAVGDDFPRKIDRKGAKGYKTFVIDSDIVNNTPIKVITDGDSLRMCVDDSVPYSMEQAKVRVTKDDGSVVDEVKSVKRYDMTDDVIYTFLLTEVGLYGYFKVKPKTYLDSEVSVISLDGKYFLLTLYKGSIAINFNGKIMIPSVQLAEEDNVSVKTDNILWKNYTMFEELLHSPAYDNDPSRFFYYDFERYFHLSGSKENGLIFREDRDKKIDISLGQYAIFEQKMLQKEAEKKAKEDNKKLINAVSSNAQIEFDDEDDYDYDDEDDDDDEEVDVDE